MTDSPAAVVDPRRLACVVFCSGAAALAVEVCASRLLAPFFGNSTIVWANIIGLILLYLAVGSAIGGRIADRAPRPEVLGRVILLAATATALLPFIAHPILATAVTALNGLSAGAVVASFFATLLLFAVPVTLLGMVAPFAMRLGLRDVASAGAVAGRLYAVSTLGSIVGTFLPALILIPAIGTQRTMIAAAALLGITAVLLTRPRAVLVGTVIAALTLAPASAIKEQAGLMFQQESAYQYVSVVQKPDGERDLELNEGVAVHSEWRPQTVLTGGEWDMFLVAPALLSHPVHRVLIIGNAGGTMARQYARYWPSASIDGVELDATVTQAGRDYLGMNDATNLTVHEADGRTFLALSHAMYDVIILDAYRQPYIPFYLATQEFFALCRAHLTSGGLVALNVERIPGDAALSDTIESTLASEMPDSWRWPALKFNELLIGVNTDSVTVPAVQQHMHSDISVLGTLFTAQVQPPNAAQTPMTDDHAPIEWLTDRGLIEYIASGGRLDEPGLPTGQG